MISDAYRPHVYLDGRKLPDDLAFTDLTPLRSFSIKWGAADWYSDVEPAELTLTLLDPLGEFLRFAENDRIPVTIRRDDPTTGPESVVVFTGSVVSGTSELTSIRRADNTEIDCWLVTITAKDPLHVLAQNRTHGPRYYARAGVDMGADWHFGPCRMGDRKNDLDNRSPAPIDWEPAPELDWLDDEIVMVDPVSGYEVNQNVSTLTVLRQTARISDILNRPYYDPQRGIIDFVSPGKFAWTDRGTFIDEYGVLHTAENNVTMLSGDRFRPAAGRIEAATEAVEQVNRIELHQRVQVDITGGGLRTRETNETVTERTFVPGVAQMTVAITTDYSTGYDMPGLWFMGAGSLIQQAYGSQSLGQLVWHPRTQADMDAHATWMLNPYPRMTASYHAPMLFTLVDSLTNWLPNSGPFGITGGTIAFGKQGWQVTVDTAPAGVTDYNSMTLGDINTWVNIGWLPPYLLADYQKINGNI